MLLISLDIVYEYVGITHFRFSPTRPPGFWSGVRMSLSHGPACPQAFPESEGIISNTTAALKIMPRKRLSMIRKVRMHSKVSLLHHAPHFEKEG